MAVDTQYQLEIVSTITQRPPRFSGFNHMSIPVRDRAEAVRFFTEVLGADVALENPTFTEVRLAGTIIGLSQQQGGWTAPDAEFPHYGFSIEGQDMQPMKERLEAYGIPTHAIWTRHGVEALMYFRDPSGNLFELYCTQGYPQAGSAPRPKGWGGEFKVDFRALNYDSWGQKG
jgi:catechol 2,3-dioxygenase-like lactoylglutathione lyase family enzyme